MPNNGMEVEAKFRNPDPVETRQQLHQIGAEHYSPRQFETNLRFDRPAKTLSERGKVLRLRQDHRCTLTYKRSLARPEVRKELEIEVEDFDLTRAILEELGFEVIFEYEKYRETYQLDSVWIMLDELPFGEFIEIEGPSLDDVEKTAEQCGLEWDHRIPKTYMDLFENLRQKYQLPIRDSTFQAFASLPPSLLEKLDLLSTGFSSQGNA